MVDAISTVSKELQVLVGLKDDALVSTRDLASETAARVSSFALFNPVLKECRLCFVVSYLSYLFVDTNRSTRMEVRVFRVVGILIGLFRGRGTISLNIEIDMSTRTKFGHCLVLVFCFWELKIKSLGTSYI